MPHVPCLPRPCVHRRFLQRYRRNRNRRSSCSLTYCVTQRQSVATPLLGRLERLVRAGYRSQTISPVQQTYQMALGKVCFLISAKAFDTSMLPNPPLVDQTEFQTGSVCLCEWAGNILSILAYPSKVGPRVNKPGVKKSVASILPRRCLFSIVIGPLVTRACSKHSKMFCRRMPYVELEGAMSVPVSGRGSS